MKDARIDDESIKHPPFTLSWTCTQILLPEWISAHLWFVDHQILIQTGGGYFLVSMRLVLLIPLKEGAFLVSADEYASSTESMLSGDPQGSVPVPVNISCSVKTKVIICARQWHFRGIGRHCHCISFVKSTLCELGLSIVQEFWPTGKNGNANLGLAPVKKDNFLSR